MNILTMPDTQGLLATLAGCLVLALARMHYRDSSERYAKKASEALSPTVADMMAASGAPLRRFNDSEDVLLRYVLPRERFPRRVCGCPGDHQGQGQCEICEEVARA
jgi:hypothetical protein